MARSVRIEYPGAVYHITSRGNERRDIFRDDDDREAFLDLLRKTVVRFRWKLLSYVLMSNHFHLVVETPEPNLSRGMHWLNGSYAGRFNRVHGRWGHLLGGRFKALLVEREVYLQRLLRYVVLNPVAAEMVARPEDYRWSSYRAMAGLEPVPSWLDAATVLEWFGDDPAQAAAGYQEYVAEAIGVEDNLWESIINGIYLGTESWAKQMRHMLQSKRRSREHPRTERAVGRPKMGRIVRVVAALCGLRSRVVRAMRGGVQRRLIAWLAWNEGLLRLREIAAALGLRSAGHVSTEIRRCQRELATDTELVALAERALIRFQN